MPASDAARNSIWRWPKCPLLKGQTAGAIEQLQLAQQAGDANFYEMSVIDGRLREMKKRQLEEMKERRN